MKRYSRDDIIAIIDAVIDGDKPILEWEYFTTTKHNDPFSAYWSRRCHEIEERFGDIEHGKLITEHGVKELGKLREELQRVEEH